MTDYIGAYRVGSRHLQSAPKQMFKPMPITEANRRIADAIPMYPESVSMAYLCTAFGLSHFAMQQKLTVIQERYLVAEDCGRLTRIGMGA